MGERQNPPHMGPAGGGEAYYPDQSTAPSTPGGQPAIGVGDDIPARLVELLPSGSAVVISSIGGKPVTRPWSAELVYRHASTGEVWLERLGPNPAERPSADHWYRVLFVNDWAGTRPGGA